MKITDVAPMKIADTAPAKPSDYVPSLEQALIESIKRQESLLASQREAAVWVAALRFEAQALLRVSETNSVVDYEAEYTRLAGRVSRFVSQFCG